MLDDPGQDPAHLDHPNVHVAALFDGAIQFAREMVDAHDQGRNRYVEMRSSWIQVVLADLAERVSWGTGMIGLQIAAIMRYLSNRLDEDATTREGIATFVSDLGTVYGLWSMICGQGTATRAA